MNWYEKYGERVVRRGVFVWLPTLMVTGWIVTGPSAASCSARLRTGACGTGVGVGAGVPRVTAGWAVIARGATVVCTVVTCRDVVTGVRVQLCWFSLSAWIVNEVV